MEETERHSKESICLPMFPGPLALGWGHVTSPGQWDVSRNDDVCHFTHEKCEKPMHKSPNSLPHTWWEATVYPGDAVPRWRSLHQPKALSDWVEESPWGPVWDMECEWEVNLHYIKTLRLKKKKKKHSIFQPDWYKSYSENVISVSSLLNSSDLLSRRKSLLGIIGV